MDLSLTESPFYNILIAELGGEDAVDAVEKQQAKDVVQSLVKMLDEATQIVDFFNKWDEQKRVKRNIKHSIIEHFDQSLVRPVTDRFMELAEVKFK